MILPDHKVQVHVPTGGMDQDKDVREIVPGDYFSARNMIIRYGKATNMRGNFVVPTTIPNGINRCIGRYID